MRVNPLMAALDTNKDGDLSAEEIEQAAKALLLLDKNKDGKIVASELRPAPTPVIIPPAEIVERLMEFDRNSDGKLTIDELPGRLKSIGKEIDTDKDGVLSQTELTTYVDQQEAERRKEDAERLKAQQEKEAAVPPPPPTLEPQGQPRPPQRVAPLMAALDTNKDGDLSAEEIANAPAAIRTLDTNRDSKITAEEMRPAFAPGERGGERPAEVHP